MSCTDMLGKSTTALKSKLWERILSFSSFILQYTMCSTANILFWIIIQLFISQLSFQAFRFRACIHNRADKDRLKLFLKYLPASKTNILHLGQDLFLQIVDAFLSLLGWMPNNNMYLKRSVILSREMMQYSYIHGSFYIYKQALHWY